MRIVLRRLVPAASILVAGAVAVPLASADGPAGLKAEYFGDTNLTEKVAEQVDAQINFNWNTSHTVAGQDVGDDFSARWSGSITPRHSERYTFITRTDDGVRLWIDGKLVIDDWQLHAAAERSGQIDLVAGRAYDIKLEYFDAMRHASARLSWESASQSREIVPASVLSPSAGPAPGPGPGPDPDPVVGPLTPVNPAAGPKSVIPGAAPGVTDVVPGAEVPEGAAGPLDAPAPPVAGQTFNAAPAGDGVVTVRRPGDDKVIPLEQGASLPIGTHVDIRQGEVAMQTAPAKGFEGETQNAVFAGATIRVGQKRRGKRFVNLDLLNGDFESCRKLTLKAKRRNVASSAAKRRSGRVVRQLFGKGKGRFRTRGRHAAATVRGTTWQVADRCDETVVKVTEGLVEVEDFLRNKLVMVGAGERYSARRR
jgi:hypothetical protein